jgi:plastin-1
MHANPKSAGLGGPELVRHQEQKGVHHYSPEERAAFVSHINFSCGGFDDAKPFLPISTEGNDLFEKCADGRLLCALINSSVPGTIDERVINRPKGGKKLDPWSAAENLNLAINSAASIGCTVVNVGANDIQEGRAHIILGLIWQIIRIGLLANVSLTAHPELYRLLEPGEDIQDLLKLPPEQILLRWVNYHLKNAGREDKCIKNFSGDIKDSEAYTILLNQLAPDRCNQNALRERDHEKRAGMVLENAKKIEKDGQRIDWADHMKPTDITSGNSKLNLAFVANLFNVIPGLEKLSEEEAADLDFSTEGSREARAFALWLNSLGIDPYVNNLFEDLRDGLVLLRAEEAIEPGSVNWKMVKEGRVNNFQKIGNCQVAVDTGLNKPFKFSLVGIQGADINDGNKTLTLAIVWQLMRHHVISILKSLSDDGKPIEEKQMIAWANEKVKAAGKSSVMRSFQDNSLANGHFFIDLCFAIREKSVNYEHVLPGNNPDECLDNAKYAISTARKLGAVIFCLPEDIVEVKPKMLLTLVGSLMAVDKRNAK